MKNPNSDYYQRPSTSPQIGQSIGNALQQFLAARQNQQKMALLQQEIGWKNPERAIGPNEQERALMENYQKGLAARMAYGDPLNFNQFRQQAMGGGTPQPQGAAPINPITPAQPPQGGTQSTDIAAKMAALKAELWEAFKAEQAQGQQ